jgi:hypothetical protein
VHELHRLYHVQKTLMAECDSHRYQPRAEGTHEVVQGSRSNLKCSPSTSGTNQSALHGNAQYQAPQQVHENIYCSFLFVYCHNVHALYYIHYMLVFLHLRFPEIISDDKSNIVVP